jgi:site-specific recombinase XerD
LVETAKDYAKNASSENTSRAYAKDFAHYTSWCRRNGFDPLLPEVQTIGRYISACAAGDTRR